jgi:hypothetical protein
MTNAFSMSMHRVLYSRINCLRMGTLTNLLTGLESNIFEAAHELLKCPQMPRSIHSNHVYIQSIFHHQLRSQRIHKLRILPIRQVQPLLVLELHILRLRSQNSFLGILPPAIPVDEQHVHETHAPAADDGDLGGNVAWSVFGSEGLWADDVADAGEGALVWWLGA